MKKLFVIFCFLIALLNINAQGFNKRFALGYPGIFGRSIVEKDSKYYTIAIATDSASTHKSIGVFVCFDEGGVPLYTTKVDIQGSKIIQVEQNLIKTKDKGFANSGAIYFDKSIGVEAMLLKFDSLGTLQFYKSYQSGDSNNFKFTSEGLIETDDGGYLLVGYVQYPNYRNGGIVIKTDSLGNELWRKSYPYQYFSLKTTKVFKSEKGYIITGTDDNYLLINSQMKIYPYMMEIDTAGNVLWKWWYTGDTKTGVTYQGIRTDDGGYILSGYKIIGQNQSGDLYKRACLVKLDSNRNKLWERVAGEVRYGYYANCYLNRTIQVESNNLLSCGSESFMIDSSTGGELGYILKCSANGDSIWKRNYHLTQVTTFNINVFNDIVHTTNNEYVLVGEADDFIQIPNAQQLWLLKVDSKGCVQENYCSGSKPVGIDKEQVNEGRFKIYPNPSKDKLMIEFEAIQADAYSVYDLAGREVLSGVIESNLQQVNVADLSKGMYLIQLSRQGRSAGVGKILKE